MNLGRIDINAGDVRFWSDKEARTPRVEFRVDPAGRAHRFVLGALLARGELTLRVKGTDRCGHQGVLIPKARIWPAKDAAGQQIPPSEGMFVAEPLPDRNGLFGYVTLRAHEAKAIRRDWTREAANAKTRLPSGAAIVPPLNKSPNPYLKEDSFVYFDTGQGMRLSFEITPAPPETIEVCDTGRYTDGITGRYLLGRRARGPVHLPRPLEGLLRSVLDGTNPFARATGPQRTVLQPSEEDDQFVRTGIRTDMEVYAPVPCQWDLVCVPAIQAGLTLRVSERREGERIVVGPVFLCNAFRLEEFHARKLRVVQTPAGERAVMEVRWPPRFFRQYGSVTAYPHVWLRQRTWTPFRGELRDRLPFWRPMQEQMEQMRQHLSGHSDAPTAGLPVYTLPPVPPPTGP